MARSIISVLMVVLLVFGLAVSVFADASAAYDFADSGVQVFAAPQRVAYEQILELIKHLNCTVHQKVNSLKGQVRYFLHQDNPEKAQYAKADLKYFGGFDPDLYLGNTEINRHIALREMREFIENNCIEYFCDFYSYCDRSRPDWSELLDDTCSFTISTFIKDFRYKLRDQQQ